MPSTFTRRGLLSAGALAVALGGSGCLSSLDGGSGDDAPTLRLSLYRGDGPLREEFVVDLDETEAEWEEDAFAAARNGTDYTTQYRLPFGAREGRPEYARHDGTYYRLGSVVVDEATVEHPVLRLFDGGGVDEADDTSDAVAHESLPELDQRAVHVAHMAARARGNEGGYPVGLVQRGGYVYRREDAARESRLLAADGPGRVTYRERVYDAETTTETFHEPVYRPTADPVARSPDRMEAVLRVQFVDGRFDRSDLSAAERELLRTASGEDGYVERHPFSDAYESVLAGLDRRMFVDGNVEKDAYEDPEGPRYLLYDGDYYEYHLGLSSGE